MSDFNIKLTIRNAHILRRIREAHNSTAAFCRKFDLPVNGVNALICMRERPFTKDGELRSVAADLCSALGAAPGELWPKDMAKIKARRAQHEVEITQAEALTLASSAEESVVAKQLIGRWSKSLTPRQITAVSMHVAGSTFQEIGMEVGGVSPERARQIIMKGLRNMRSAALRDGVRRLEDISG